jgi:hypothetical protein
MPVNHAYEVGSMNSAVFFQQQPTQLLCRLRACVRVRQLAERRRWLTPLRVSASLTTRIGAWQQRPTPLCALLRVLCV